MKMRLQLASVLPAPANAGPFGSTAKGVFGATLQGMMGVPDTANTKPSAMSVAPLSKLVQVGADVGRGERTGPLEELVAHPHRISEDAQAGPPSPGISSLQAIDLPEQIEGPIVPQPGNPGTAVLKEPLSESGLQTALIEQPILESTIAPRLPRLLPGQNDPTREPIAAATSHLPASAKDESPLPAHKAETTHDEIHATSDPSVGMGTPVLQLANFVVPVTPQPEGSQPAPSKPASNAVSSSGPSGRGPSRRAPVQSMITSRSGAADKSLAALGSQTLARAGGTLAAEGGEPLGRPTAAADRLAGSQPTPASKQKAGATTPITPAAQPLESRAAHSVVESAEGTRSQMDPSVAKDVAGKAGTELKSEIKPSITLHSIPGPVTVEHQATPNPSPVILHGTEKGITTHRPETNAAQMLQKMDMAASPGVVQLRADARRLDVGISAGTLGWVEVRATSGPSGRVDATLQTQNDASAHLLAGQSSEISSYAREHSVQLGQLSVGVGTGGSTPDQSRSTHHGSQDENATLTRSVRSKASPEQVHHGGDVVSLINVRV